MNDVGGGEVLSSIPIVVGINGPYTNVGATIEAGEPAPPPTSCTGQGGWCTGESPSNTVWLRFAAPASGVISLHFSPGDWDSQIALWSAASCSDLLSSATKTLLAANDDSSGNSPFNAYIAPICVIPGQTYWVQVDGYQNVTSAFSIELKVESVDDGNVCTIDACTPITGIISHTQIIPDDHNVCTIDVCDPSIGDVHTLINYSDNNVCTFDDCDPLTGVFHTLIDVDDNQICTTDGCDSITGLIYHLPIEIDDHDTCTFDFCDAVTGTAHSPVNVDDGLACTYDDCDQINFITHTPISGCTFDCQKLVDDYSNEILWVPVGLTTFIDGGNTNRVIFNHIPGFADQRVYRHIDGLTNNSLGRRWRAEFDFFPDTANNDAANSGTSVNLFSLTDNALPPYRTWSNSYISPPSPWYASAQSIINVSLISGDGPNYQHLTKIYVGAKDHTPLPPGGPSIPIFAQMDLPQWNHVYYVRLEQLDATQVRISVFSNNARTIQIPGSPQCFDIPASLNFLNTVQHGNIDEAGDGRRFTGWVDNTVIDTCNHIDINSNADFTINNHYCYASAIQLNSLTNGAGYSSVWEITDNGTGRIVGLESGNATSVILQQPYYTEGHCYSVRHILSSNCVFSETTKQFCIYVAPAMNITPHNATACGIQAASAASSRRATRAPLRPSGLSNANRFVGLAST